jgi:hypothetical protein
MIFDMQTLLSDAQAITATAASTNTIDLGPIANGIVRDLGKGKPIPLRIQVVQDFTNLTSLKFELQTDDNTGFGSAKTVWAQTYVLADLKAGKVIVPEWIARGTDERYMRLYYTVTGTAPDAGKVTAGVVAGAQSNG